MDKKQIEKIKAWGRAMLNKLSEAKEDPYPKPTGETRTYISSGLGKPPMYLVYGGDSVVGYYMKDVVTKDTVRIRRDELPMQARLDLDKAELALDVWRTVPKGTNAGKSEILHGRPWPGKLSYNAPIQAANADKAFFAALKPLFTVGYNTPEWAADLTPTSCPLPRTSPREAAEQSKAATVTGQIMHEGIMQAKRYFLLKPMGTGYIVISRWQFETLRGATKLHVSTVAGLMDAYEQSIKNPTRLVAIYLTETFVTIP